MPAICVRRDKKNLVSQTIAAGGGDLTNFRVTTNLFRYIIPKGLYLNAYHTCNLPLVTSYPDLIPLGITSEVTYSQEATPARHALGQQYPSDILFVREILLEPMRVACDWGDGAGGNDFIDHQYNLAAYEPGGSTSVNVLVLDDPADSYAIGQAQWEMWFSEQPASELVCLEELCLHLVGTNNAAGLAFGGDRNTIYSLPIFTPTSYNIGLGIAPASSPGEAPFYNSARVWFNGLPEGHFGHSEPVNGIDGDPAPAELSHAPLQLTGTANFGVYAKGAVLHCFSTATGVTDNSVQQNWGSFMVSAQATRNTAFYRQAEKCPDFVGPAQ